MSAAFQRRVLYGVRDGPHDRRCVTATRDFQDGIDEDHITVRSPRVRLGEASHLGPISKRRRMLRSRAMQQSWDSGGDSSEDESHRVTQLDSPFFRRCCSFGARFVYGTKANPGGQQ